MIPGTKRRQVKTGNLLLDSRNSRIPPNRRSDDPRALLHELVRHENIKKLATSITKLGLFPNERLIVVPSGRRFIVLEGNRRLAAIKLLFNPELAETSTQVKSFRSLSAKANLADLAEIDVLIVPNRIIAAPIIANLHTGNAKKRWSSLQQARFYRELVDNGQSPAEVAEQIGVNLGHVRDYLRSETLYNLALQLDYPAEVKKKIDDAGFSLTTLDRFFEYRAGRQFLGVEIDEQHGFIGKVHPERFRAVLQRVATDVATVKGLSRRVNDDDGFKEYIEKAERQIPKTKKRGAFIPGELLGTIDKKTEKDPQKPAKPKRLSRQSKSIVPPGFSGPSKLGRARNIFNELKKIQIKTQPNSTGVMFRVLIDIALWSYIKTEGHDKAACDHLDRNGKKRKRNPDWTPSLRELISYSVDKRIFRGMTAGGYKAVRTLASKDSEYFITIDGLNAFTHNPHVTPIENDLRALWQRAEPMLEIILM